EREERRRPSRERLDEEERGRCRRQHHRDGHRGPEAEVGGRPSHHGVPVARDHDPAEARDREDARADADPACGHAPTLTAAWTADGVATTLGGMARQAQPHGTVTLVFTDIEGSTRLL